MPSVVRIGVNALYLIPGGVGGTEIYLRNLLAALAEIDHRNRYLVFTHSEAGADICPGAPNVEPVVSALRASVRPARLLWEQTGLALQTFTHKLDVLFSPGFSSPLLSRCRKVTVIHDLQHIRQPRNFGFLERQAWRFMVWSSARLSDTVVTVSENSRSDIVNAYGLPSERVRVIGHGVEPEFFNLQNDDSYDGSWLQKLLGQRCRYLLAVSTLHPHKNWLRLLDAYEELLREGHEEHLVVAGLAGKSSHEIQERILDHGLISRVHLLGWQPRQALLELYKFAAALVFPSTFEGFGMPVAEAMAAGVPVVCSDIPPLREIANGPALFFDSASTQDLTRRLREVLDAQPGQLDDRLTRGREHATRFSWRRAAEETLAVLLEAARR